jgi:RimJ/RimL family protein N-acetyltransferase
VTTIEEWPAELGPLAAERLDLEPLGVGHADEMAPVLGDPALHSFTGGEPATREELRRRYARQGGGWSADGTERWLNWVLRRRDDARLVGFVQATVTSAGGVLTAELAWVIGSADQGRGYAGEAAGAMLDWLRRNGVMKLVAQIHPEHAASNGVARRIGLVPTDQVVDGEVRWVGPGGGEPGTQPH